MEKKFVDFLVFEFDKLFPPPKKLVFKTKQHTPDMCGMYAYVYKPFHPE